MLMDGMNDALAVTSLTGEHPRCTGLFPFCVSVCVFFNPTRLSRHSTPVFCAGDGEGGFG